MQPVRLRLLLGFIAVLITATPRLSAQPFGEAAGFMPNEVLVQFDPNAGDEHLADALRRGGFTVKKLIPFAGRSREDSGLAVLNQGIDLKQRHGLNIVAINASYGSMISSLTEQIAVLRAAKAGILVVAAAGNSGLMDGTSMATPHVTGACALYLGAFPGAMPWEIKDAILADAVPTPSLSGNTLTGGRLNVSNFRSP